MGIFLRTKNVKLTRPRTGTFVTPTNGRRVYLLLFIHAAVLQVSNETEANGTLPNSATAH